MTLSVIINIPPSLPFSHAAVQFLALSGDNGHFLRFPAVGAAEGPQKRLRRLRMNSILVFPYSPSKPAAE